MILIGSLSSVIADDAAIEVPAHLRGQLEIDPTRIPETAPEPTPTEHEFALVQERLELDDAASDEVKALLEEHTEAREAIRDKYPGGTSSPRQKRARDGELRSLKNGAEWRLAPVLDDRKMATWGRLREDQPTPAGSGAQP